MTPNQTFAVVLRLFAIWLGLQALQTLPAFFLPNVFDAPGTVYAIFLLVLTVVLVLVLWFFPRAVTGRLLPPPDAQSQTTVTPDTWLAMGCALIGLWILATRIPRLAFDFFAWNSMAHYEDHSKLFRGVLYDLIELAIALWLVFGARGFRAVFWWAQNAGTRKAL